MNTKAGNRELGRWLRSEFAYGESDCAIMAASVVTAVTGRDDILQAVHDLRGTYRTETGARRKVLAWLRHKGFDPGKHHPYEALARYFLGKPVAPLQVKRFGVLIGEWGRNGLSFGVCDGSNIVVMVNDGVERIALTEADKGWNIV